MVRIMLTPRLQHPEEPSPSPVPGMSGGYRDGPVGGDPLPALGSSISGSSSGSSGGRFSGSGGASSSGSSSSSSDRWGGEGCWGETMAARNEPPPRDAATCIMWCAIALGALVRGCPLSLVGIAATASSSSLKMPQYLVLSAPLRAQTLTRLVD